MCTKVTGNKHPTRAYGYKVVRRVKYLGGPTKTESASWLHTWRRGTNRARANPPYLPGRPLFFTRGWFHIITSLTQARKIRAWENNSPCRHGCRVIRVTFDPKRALVGAHCGTGNRSLDGTPAIVAKTVHWNGRFVK